MPTVIAGGDVNGLIRYLYSKGRANEHDPKPRIIDAWRSPEAIDPLDADSDRRDLRRLIQRLEEPNQLMRTPRKDYVRHIPIAAGRETVKDGVKLAADRELTDAEFSELAREILDRTGMTRRRRPGVPVDLGSPRGEPRPRGDRGPPGRPPM